MKCLSDISVSLLFTLYFKTPSHCQFSEIIWKCSFFLTSKAIMTIDENRRSAGFTLVAMQHKVTLKFVNMICLPSSIKRKWKILLGTKTDNIRQNSILKDYAVLKNWTFESKVLSMDHLNDLLQRDHQSHHNDPHPELISAWGSGQHLDILKYAPTNFCTHQLKKENYVQKRILWKLSLETLSTILQQGVSFALVKMSVFCWHLYVVSKKSICFADKCVGHSVTSTIRWRRWRADEREDRGAWTG